MATSRPSRGSCARYTSPIPPAPNRGKDFVVASLPPDWSVLLVKFSLADQKRLRSCVTAHPEVSFLANHLVNRVAPASRLVVYEGFPPLSHCRMRR